VPRKGPDSDRYASDVALVRRMLAGDETAFREFFDASFRPLFRFARTRLRGDAVAAEDVVQAVLGRALSKLDTYRGEAALLTWLFTICRHELADHFTREGRLGEPVELAADAPEIRAALESLGALAADPEDQLERGEVVHRVWAALDVLPARYGDALEWKYIHGLSVQEIAGRLGVGIKAAESVLSRAREAFREAFVAAAPAEEPS
jgi:RNA polymerase sigma-70 factor (ECF subfamily)